MDYIVELPPSDGMNAILVIVDRFSKMSYFIPTTTNITAKETAQLFMTHIFTHHGLPQEVVSDRGPQFTSHFWLQILLDLGIKRSLSLAYHPQSNGQIESFNKILKQMLRKTVADNQKDWHDT